MATESQVEKLRKHFDAGGTCTVLNFFELTNGTNFEERRNELEKKGYRLSWKWITTKNGSRVKEWRKASSRYLDEMKSINEEINLYKMRLNERPENHPEREAILAGIKKLMNKLDSAEREFNKEAG